MEEHIMIVAIVHNFNDGRLIPFTYGPFHQSLTAEKLTAVTNIHEQDAVEGVYVTKPLEA